MGILLSARPYRGYSCLHLNQYIRTIQSLRISNQVILSPSRSKHNRADSSRILDKSAAVHPSVQPAIWSHNAGIQRPLRPANPDPDEEIKVVRDLTQDPPKRNQPLDQRLRVDRNQLSTEFSRTCEH